MIFMKRRALAGHPRGRESSRYHHGVSTAELHLEAPLLRTHALPATAGHVLHVSEHGTAEGIPALLLHGGPGSGCSPLLRRFFDPRQFRIICLDQRGSGASRPRGATQNNTTGDLLQDLHRLREHLGLARWLVVGGSWGATLGLAHAAAEPGAVEALLLRATFLARREDIDGFFQGSSHEDPLAWQRFASVAPAEHRDALLPWLVRVMAGGETALQARAARAWWEWERLLSGASLPAEPPQGEALAALVDRCRVQSHYMGHDCWLDKPPLLERCRALPRVPTLLLHASNDRVCRPEGVKALHAELPHSRLRWVEGAGHDPAHPAMARAMVAALDRYAACRDFDGHATP